MRSKNRIDGASFVAVTGAMGGVVVPGGSCVTVEWSTLIETGEADH